MRRYIIFIMLNSMGVQTYSMETPIVLTADENVKKDYLTLCYKLKEKSEERFKIFQSDLRAGHIFIEKIEGKFEKIKQNLARQNANTLLAFKTKFNLDDNMWSYCMLTAKNVTQLINALNSSDNTIDRPNIDPNIPDQLITILKYQLYKKNINPKNFSIFLNDDNSFSIQPPNITGTVSATGYSFTSDLVQIPGAIGLSSFYKSKAKKCQKNFCRKITYELSENKADFIIRDMILAYQGIFNNVYTKEDIPKVLLDTSLHIALIKPKYAHKELEDYTHCCSVGDSSTTYELLTKIARYWDMLELLKT